MPVNGRRGAHRKLQGMDRLMTKTILILTDGMADEALPELGGKTPLEFAQTPNMDWIAQHGACGSFLSLPAGFPTSSDVANMSVMGYDLATCYTGRGALEALSQGLPLGPLDVAWRCNLVYVEGQTLRDYSAGHIGQEHALALMGALARQYNDAKLQFHPGVSYRNLLILHGEEFTEAVEYQKPDASQDMDIGGLMLKAKGNDPKSHHTARFLNELTLGSRHVLEEHPLVKSGKCQGNMIWPWSPGRRPRMPSFQQKYGARGAVVSAVDVIFGLGAAAGMTNIRVPGATGFIDTNYEGKAEAAVKALADHDFVYLHVEAADECSHMGELKLKLKAIEDIDRRLIGRLRELLAGQEVTLAVLPDHPVPIKQRIHTRTPVPVAICGPHIKPDGCQAYSETVAPSGSLGTMSGDQLMRRILNV